MDKLELKHIAPYLPYGLKVQYIHTGEVGVIRNLVDIDDYDTIKVGIDYKCSEHIWMFKPILRPLSLLTKEIEHHGERFVPYDTNIFTKYRMNTLHPKHINIVGMPYWCVQKLIEWHFDVFGLRDKNLCIYYNEL